LRIKVYSSPFVSSENINSDGYVTIDEGATVNALFKKIKIPLPLRPFMFFTVNHNPAKLTQKLKDGDTVSFFTIFSGG
jgi:molybdopterin converting factor small subunit